MLKKILTISLSAYLYLLSNYAIAENVADTKKQVLRSECLNVGINCQACYRSGIDNSSKDDLGIPFTEFYIRKKGKTAEDSYEMPNMKPYTCARAGSTPSQLASKEITLTAITPSTKSGEKPSKRTVNCLRMSSFCAVCTGVSEKLQFAFIDKNENPDKRFITIPDMNFFECAADRGPESVSSDHDFFSDNNKKRRQLNYKFSGINRTGQCLGRSELASNNEFISFPCQLASKDDVKKYEQQQRNLKDFDLPIEGPSEAVVHPTPVTPAPGGARNVGD